MTKEDRAIGERLMRAADGPRQVEVDSLARSAAANSSWQPPASDFGPPNSAPAKRLQRIEDLPSIWDLDTKQNEWLLEGTIPAGAITLFTGAPGVGKSMVMLALVGTVLSGGKFLGRSCLQRPVLILDRENPLSVIRERIDLFGIEPDPALHYWGNWHEQLYGSPEPTCELVRVFAQQGPLIVVDSLVAFHPGSEQDATETRSFLQVFRNLAAAGATVVIIHHTGKGDTTKDYRGSSDIAAAVDAAFAVERPTGANGISKLVLRNFKMRCSEQLPPIEIEFLEDRFEARAALRSNETTELRQKHQDLLHQVLRDTPGLSRTAAVEALHQKNITKRQAQDAIEAAISDGRIVSKRGGRGGGEVLSLAGSVEVEI